MKSQENNSLRPKVGIGVMVFKGDKVLVGKRIGAHGANTFAWPGGHLEYGESLEDCARREVLEETGMKIKNLKFIRLLNTLVYPPHHYVDISFYAEWDSGVPTVMEPDKCLGWDWYSIDSLPEPLFKTIPSTIEAYKTGKLLFDSSLADVIQ